MRDEGVVELGRVVLRGGVCDCEDEGKPRSKKLHVRECEQYVRESKRESKGALCM